MIGAPRVAAIAGFSTRARVVHRARSNRAFRLIPARSYPFYSVLGIYS